VLVQKEWGFIERGGARKPFEPSGTSLAGAFRRVAFSARTGEYGFATDSETGAASASVRVFEVVSKTWKIPPIPHT
jgi:hypothetical protein